MPRELNIKQIFKNGFTDLVPIVPGEKRPVVKDWPNFVMTMERLEFAAQSEVNTFGLKAKFFPGIDIDIKAPKLAEGIRALAQEILGVAPTRYGDRPKCLLLYRTNTPFRKFSLRFQSKLDPSIKGAIEILGDGQQYIIAGHHPTAGLYEYAPGEDIDLINADELTVIDEEQVKEFLMAVESKLNPEKWEIIERRSGAATAVIEVDPQLLLAPSLQIVQKCVEQTENNTDWDGFVEFGLAIWGATGGSTEGLSIFKEWASKWTQGAADPADAVKLWRTATPRSGWNRLQWLAKKFGTSYTEDQSAQYDFKPEVAPNYPKERDTTFNMADVISAQGIAKYAMKTTALNELRYDPYEERWWRFMNGCWITTSGSGNKKGLSLSEERIKHLLAEMAAWLLEQPAGLGDAQENALIRLTAKETRGKVRAQLEQEQSFWVKRIDFDDPEKTNHLLNTPAGTYDLETGTMRPHNPDDLITKITKISPKFNADKHPLFTDMLNMVLQFSDEAISYLQRYLGSAMGGSLSGSKVLLVMLGESNSGKTTITDTIATNIMGDYGTVTSEGVLLQKPKTLGNQHPTGTAHILPARFAVLHEGTADKEWNASLVKQLTGGDAIASRKMNKDFENNRFYGKLVLSCNDLPMMDAMDSGMRQRIAVMQFTRIAEANLKLKAVKIIQGKEAPYIFGWLLSGYALEQANPVAVFDNRPEDVKATTEAIFEDPMTAFVEACLDLTGIQYTRASEIHEAYNRFVDDERFAMTAIGFGMRFNRHPLIMGRKSKRQGKMCYNLTIKPTEWQDS